MTTSNPTDTGRDRRARGAIAAMSAGLVLSVAATSAPYVDRSAGRVLAHHLQHGYPTYTATRVDTAVDAWLTILTVVGVLGVACWSAAIWAVGTRRPWARPMSTLLFLGGTSLALAALLTPDTSGEVGLAPLLGWIGVLPSVAGLAAVGILWTPTAACPPREPGR